MDLYKTLGEILKPEPIYKPKFFYIRKAVLILQKVEKTNNIKDVLNLVNELVTLHKTVLNLIKELEVNKEWYLLQNDPDYYQLQYTIEGAYFKAKNKYHDLHWDLYGFNAY